jgi:hypothetical protein
MVDTDIDRKYQGGRSSFIGHGAGNEALDYLSQKQRDVDASGISCAVCGNNYCVKCMKMYGKPHPISGGLACLSCGGNMTHYEGKDVLNTENRMLTEIPKLQPSVFRMKKPIAEYHDMRDWGIIFLICGILLTIIDYIPIGLNPFFGLSFIIGMQTISICKYSLIIIGIILIIIDTNKKTK